MAKLSGPRRAAQSGRADSLVIFLHGYGADGNDLIGLGEALAPHLPGTVFLSPNAPERCANNPFGYQWFPIPWLDGSSKEASEQSRQQSIALLNAYLDEVVETEGIDPEHTFLFGFSQGTMMSLHVAPRRQKAYAGVVGFSGRLLEPEKLAVEAVSKPPVILVHGDADEMVPFASLGLAADALDAAGFDVYTHVSEGMGHGIAPDGLAVALRFIKLELAKAARH